jgi:hypothetical protein
MRNLSNQLEIRERYLKLRWVRTALRKTRMGILEQLQEEFPELSELSLGEVNSIAMTPTPQEAKEMIGRKRCPRCKTGKYIVVEAIGENSEGKPCRGFDMYCSAPDESSEVFDKCWYHFPAIR